MPTQVSHDPDFRRLKYVRYADDFLLGFIGPKSEAEVIRDRIGAFLRDELKLELSPEKTLITHAETDKARFLGYEITTWRKKDSRSVEKTRGARGVIKLLVPADVIVRLSGLYKDRGRPVEKPYFRFEDDFSIIATYGSVYRGYVQYYKCAENLKWFGHVHWAMYWSLLRTLATIHKTSALTQRRKYSASHVMRDGSVKRVLVVTKPRKNGGPDYEAVFGDVSLKIDRFAPVSDGPVPRLLLCRRNELIARLLADICEICGSSDRINVHHIRKLKDLKMPGRRVPPVWKQIMASRRRKTLVVCHHCHVAIHRGNLTERLRILIDEKRLRPSGEWVLPSDADRKATEVSTSAEKRRKG
jgi:hypothetical protein